MTNGIEYYETVTRIADHFEEEKDRLMEMLQTISRKVFRKDRMIVSYTGEPESKEPVLQEIEKFSGCLHTEEVEESVSSSHARRKTKDSRLHPRYSMWQWQRTLSMPEQSTTGASDS